MSGPAQNVAGLKKPLMLVRVVGAGTNGVHTLTKGENMRQTLPTVYIPDGAEKGDCPYCEEGVLFRDTDRQKALGIPEVYSCDICEKTFTETVYSAGNFYDYYDIKRRVFAEFKPFGFRVI